MNSISISTQKQSRLNRISVKKECSFAYSLFTLELIRSLAYRYKTQFLYSLSSSLCVCFLPSLHIFATLRLHTLSFSTLGAPLKSAFLLLLILSNSLFCLSENIQLDRSLVQQALPTLRNLCHFLHLYFFHFLLLRFSLSLHHHPRSPHLFSCLEARVVLRKQQWSSRRQNGSEINQLAEK